jgi:hypothetical protein
VSPPEAYVRFGCRRHSFGARLLSIEIGAAGPSGGLDPVGFSQEAGPLGPFVDGDRAWLVGRGYSPSVVVRSLVTLGQLGRWLERMMLAVELLTAEAVSSFLAEYRDDRGRLPGASVWPLLEYLRAVASGSLSKTSSWDSTT